MNGVKANIAGTDDEIDSNSYSVQEEIIEVGQDITCTDSYNLTQISSNSN